MHLVHLRVFDVEHLKGAIKSIKSHVFRIHMIVLFQIYCILCSIDLALYLANCNLNEILSSLVLVVFRTKMLFSQHNCYNNKYFNKL